MARRFGDAHGPATSMPFYSGNYSGTILVACGHTVLVMTVVRSGACENLVTRLAAVGRLPFTNYLSHSWILTTVSYGFCLLGLYGQASRICQICFVVAVLGFPVWVSQLWLRHFRFGLAERLRRVLTCLQPQPMRKT